MTNQKTILKQRIRKFGEMTILSIVGQVMTDVTGWTCICETWDGGKMIGMNCNNPEERYIVLTIEQVNKIITKTLTGGE